MSFDLKILMFGWEFPPNISGGLGTACFGLTKGLWEVGGTRVTFVIPKSYDDEDQSFARIIALSEAGVYLGSAADAGLAARPDAALDGGPGRRIVLKPYGSNLLQAAKEYGRCARKRLHELGAFDVIHAHDWLTCLAGIEAQKLSGKPLIFHVHSTEYDRAGEQADLNILAIERRGMEAADKIIAVSEYTRQLIIQRYGQAPEKIVTIYNATVRQQVGTLAPRERATKRISFVGRVTYQKGPGFFIEAACIALRKLPFLQFVMAGDGDLLAAMKRRCLELGIYSHFDFPGFLRNDEVAHLLARTDAYVMPSISEPFGISALEAIDAGVPAILSKQSGVVELLESVAKVDCWDVAAIADAMIRIVSDPSYADSLSRNAKAELEHIDWSRSAFALRATYHAVHDSWRACQNLCVSRVM